MELLNSLALGLGTALAPANLLYCLVGVFIGTAVGVLPGLGPTATISLLLPLTFQMDPTASIIMLAGIYYGAMYGGSITSILVNIPGEAASIVTCIDGHVMAKNGRAGPALGIAAFGSLIAGIATVAGIVLIGPPLAQVALKFGPPEKFALVVFGLTLVTFISTGSKLRSLMSALAGLLLSTVGLDIVSGQQRFTYEIPYLLDGMNLVILAMGLFGIGEVLSDAASRSSSGATLAVPQRTRDLMPTREDWRRSRGPIARGTVLGFVLGLLPGGGAMIASFASYVTEKKLSRTPEIFGRGAIEGVAGPEAANNAAAQSSFVPLLNLGIPAGAVMGVVLGALMIHGITPGPQLYVEKPALFWGVIMSMIIGNLMLVVLNVPLIGIFVRLLRIPSGILSPLILLVCIVGAYSINNNVIDVLVMFAAGLAGFLMKRSLIDPAPLIVAFVLGTLFESSLHQSLAIGYGSAWVLLQRPVSATLLAASVIVVVLSIVVPMFAKRMLEEPKPQ
jgi:putative tricarboxylic transport membrane protein